MHEELNMDKELNDVLIALIALKEARKRENFYEEDMETDLLEILEYAGFHFSGD